MANATMGKDEILDAIGNMSVIELSELIEAFKTKFNVTIAAAPVGGGARGRRRRRRPGGRRADGVRRRAQGSRRQEDPGHQGGARSSPAWASRRPRTWSTARRRR